MDSNIYILQSGGLIHKTKLPMQEPELNLQGETYARGGGGGGGGGIFAGFYGTCRYNTI